MKTLRRLLISLTAFMLLFLPDSAAAQPDYIRLHIIADSDRVRDQVIKLCVRDDIRQAAGLLLSDCESTEDAWQIIEEHQALLLEIAQNSARQYGFDGEVSIETGIFPFPDRTYGGELVPSGEYRALRITLGKGDGRNWWCVVYPSLCLPSDADIDQTIEFYSSVWHWLIQLKEAILS